MATQIICGITFEWDCCDYWDGDTQVYRDWLQASIPCNITLMLCAKDGGWLCQSSRNFNHLTEVTDPDKETAIRVCLRQTREFLTNELATFPA